MTAVGSTSFNAGAIDRTSTLLSFADGRSICIENTRHSPPERGYDQRIEVVTVGIKNLLLLVFNYLKIIIILYR